MITKTTGLPRDMLLDSACGVLEGEPEQALLAGEPDQALLSFPDGQSWEPWGEPAGAGDPLQAHEHGGHSSPAKCMGICMIAPIKSQ